MNPSQCWPARHWFLTSLLLTGSHYGAVEYGRAAADRAYIQERHQAELAQAERERQQQAALSALQTQLQAAAKRARQRTKTLEASVNASSLAPDCAFSDDGIRLWNAANAGGTAQ